jgi:hypothetical protein
MVYGGECLDGLYTDSQLTRRTKYNVAAELWSSFITKIIALNCRRTVICPSSRTYTQPCER